VASATSTFTWPAVAVLTVVEAPAERTRSFDSAASAWYVMNPRAERSGGIVGAAVHVAEPAASRLFTAYAHVVPP
jgi:hypothetical protein